MQQLRILAVVAGLMVMASPALAQMGGGASADQAVIALEKQLWEAWKKQDQKVFADTMTADAVGIGPSGMATRDQILKDIASGCDVKSYEVMPPKVMMLGADTALLTYKATQDATCGGRKLPSTVYASSIFVKKGGQWKNVFHQETPALEP